VAVALMGLDLKSFAAPAWQHSEGGLSILPRWHRRSAEASDSDESFNDSAQGETPRGESNV
jgi:predicted deacetylase